MKHRNENVRLYLLSLHQLKLIIVTSIGIASFNMNLKLDASFLALFTTFIRIKIILNFSHSLTFLASAIRPAEACGEELLT